MDSAEESDERLMATAAQQPIYGPGRGMWLAPGMGYTPDPIDVNTLLCHIYFGQLLYQVRVPFHATVEQLRRCIAEATDVPIPHQVLTGWPSEPVTNEPQLSMQLCKLGFSLENSLSLLDARESGSLDEHRADGWYELIIVERPSGKKIRLRMPGETRIGQLEADVAIISGIPQQAQQWMGWPLVCNNQTTLVQSGIGHLHYFILIDRTVAATGVLLEADETGASSAVEQLTNLDLMTTSESSTENLDEESDQSDSLDDEGYVQEPQLPLISRNLIEDNVQDEVVGCTQFVQNFVLRFGDPHPEFFSGSLADAIELSCHKPLTERKLLALYLHNADSVLANIFCDNPLKNEAVLQTLAEHFVVYGWDLTFDNNKQFYLALLTAYVGEETSLVVQSLQMDMLPGIVVVCKSRMAREKDCRVLTVVQSTGDVNEVQSQLLGSVGSYQEFTQDEVLKLRERVARQKLRDEQDLAYEETLRADIAKDEAKQLRCAAASEECERAALEKATRDALRETVRLDAEKQIPVEPGAKEATGITKIRVRIPTGGFLQRAFYLENTLQDLVNFVAANGFIKQEYKMISTWPRRDLSLLNTRQTLRSLKMCTQETLILQQR